MQTLLRVFWLFIYLPLRACAALVSPSAASTGYSPCQSAPREILPYKTVTKLAFAPPLLSPPSRKGLAFVAELYLGSPSVRQYLHVEHWTQCFHCSL
ncbi:hypothetical protein DY000_02000180 [Brassica cretica]|uniref:Secreted protein n=1 Tax=Brassica cretica TaxID=69181 RepID=A0ABQ7CI35_BRACR|nr:hypothetical protein DY000_02000180 [Brassica cretica]